jgi:preprotein translocase subunit SecG
MPANSSRSAGIVNRARSESERRVHPVTIAFSVILIITSLLMVLLVLLHKGKGGGLSDLFGGGITSSLGSSSVVERNLDRITIFTGIIWFISIVVLGILLKK